MRTYTSNGSLYIPCFTHDDYKNDVVRWSTHDRILDPGQHSFSLSGMTFPSSFEAVHDRIKYVIEARILTPNAPQYDKMISRVIQVVDTVDVSIADIMVPVEHEEQTRAWFLCFASSPVSLPVNIPQAGFCIGEGILFKYL